MDSTTSLSLLQQLQSAEHMEELARFEESLPVGKGSEHVAGVVERFDDSAISMIRVSHVESHLFNRDSIPQLGDLPKFS